VIGRRGFLKTLGAGMALSAIGSRSRAVAAPPAIPKRIIFFYGSGMLYDVWQPTGTETAFELGEVHKPLEPHKKDLIVLDGLGMVSEEIDPGPKGNAHNQGAKHALAAANTDQTDRPGGPSIDQKIAQELKKQGVLTQFPSLEFQAAGWTNELTLYSGAVASASNTLLPGMWDPRKAWDRIFGTFTGGDASAAEAYKARQMAVMGLAKDEFNRLSKKVASTDRVKLDAHLSLLSDLEARHGTPVKTCTEPDRKDIEAAFTDKCDLACYDPATPSVFAHNWELTSTWNAKMLVAAMACDLTRVGFLEMNTAANALVGYTDGDYGTTDLHDLIHKVNDRKNALNKDPGASGVIKKVCALEAQKLADLIAALKAVPEADGGTLFDHTVILWCSQIGYGSHDLAELPWVVAGSAGGAFKTGRYVKLPANPKSTRGQPHNDLFVSLANAVDVPITTFGNPDCCNGPLAAL
jgi:hypothetical protein